MPMVNLLVILQARLIAEKILNSATSVQVAVALEQAALADEYFVKRKLYPNVDFYSGVIYRCLSSSFIDAVVFLSC